MGQVLLESRGTKKFNEWSIKLYGRADDGVICSYTAEQWVASRYHAPLRHKEAA